MESNDTEIKTCASDKEINEDIFKFICDTNRYLYHLKKSREYDGWEQRLERKRGNIMKLLRKAQDLIFACMHDGKESVPYRIADLMNFLWRMLGVSDENDEIAVIARYLIVNYKDAPLMDELKDISY